VAIWVTALLLLFALRDRGSATEPGLEPDSLAEVQQAGGPLAADARQR
jgi:hypothetical protein